VVAEKPENPSVVEVYYGDPGQVLPVSSPLSSGGSAASLGKNLHQGGVSPAQPQRVFGLNPDAAQATKIVAVSKRDGRKQVFSLTQAPSLGEPVNTLELIADYQEYDEKRQVITARGNVSLQLANGILKSDRLQINLPEKLAVAEGNVILTRGDQILRGDRFEYYFVQDSGVVFNATGEVYQPSTVRDFQPPLASDISAGTVNYTVLSDRLAANQPLQRVTTAEGFRYVFGTQAQGFNTARDRDSTGPRSGATGTVNRLRFQSERLKFEGQVWQAEDVRLTNDPFSPPELEVKADRAVFRPLDDFTSELTLSRSRVVFDQILAAPTFQDRLVFDNRDRTPTIVSFGYDGRDRGGLFIERTFTVVDTDSVSLEISPQYLIQKAFFPDSFPEANPNDERVGVLSPSVFGLVTDLQVNFSERTEFSAIASFSSLNLEEIEDRVRSRIRVRQKIGNIEQPYLLNAEYNYRERLFNGTLGFRTVEQSYGFVVTSPSIPLGKTGIILSYQGSIQNIDAETDQPELIEPGATDRITNLSRFQGAFAVSKPFLLWFAPPLPATPEAGLRFTPVPVVPFLQLSVGVTGVESYYSNGDSQPSLTGTIGLFGQLGHFSRSFLDYTGFNISYSRSIVGDLSPFLFDRFVDQEIVSFGITQQIYGPIRLGIQTSFSLTLNEEISTDYFIEWSRRTYSLLIRYNPVLQLGAVNIRISDFNWTGNPGYFEGSGLRPVVGGVTR
jgi:lipopolysaccharide export system protein LptA